MPTITEYKESLKNIDNQNSLLPLFEIIEDVFKRRDSKALLLHNQKTIDDIDLNTYEKILYESYQKKERLASEYACEPTHSISEYERKIERREALFPNPKIAQSVALVK